MWGQTTKNRLTELATGTCDDEWARVARISTTKRSTLSAVHAWVTSTVVVICINVYNTTHDIYYCHTAIENNA